MARKSLFGAFLSGLISGTKTTSRNRKFSGVGTSKMRKRRR